VPVGLAAEGGRLRRQGSKVGKHVEMTSLPVQIKQQNLSVHIRSIEVLQQFLIDIFDLFLTI
jgi:hypothetical protein